MTLFRVILSALLAIDFYTLRERKFLGYMQYRKGPNKPRILAIIIPTIIIQTTVQNLTI